ncbi:MAG: hypothetical protein NTW86_07660 [Candidatus Sumerlaeota bacterium]|nr:hypothetical protein [Candidatus Sumerlaeota bacterium]
MNTGKLVGALILAAAIGLFAWGVMDAHGAGSASFYGGTQYFNVLSVNWHITYIRDWNTNKETWTDWQYGNTSFSWKLPWLAWQSFYLYDYYSGQWVEVIHLLDESLFT